MKLRKSKKLVVILIAIGVLSVGGTILGLNGFFGGGGTVPTDTMTRDLEIRL